MYVGMYVYILIPDFMRHIKVKLDIVDRNPFQFNIQFVFISLGIG